MARRQRSIQQKREIASRLQRLIEERFDTYYAFRQDMEKRGRHALASTVRGWLPPQKRWKEKRDGAAVRRVDWDAVKLPDLQTLMELCEVLELRADYVLFGSGSPYRGQTRDDQTLAEDLVARIWRDLRYNVEKMFVTMAVVHGARVNTRALLGDMSRWVREDFEGWTLRLGMRRFRVGGLSDPEFRRADRRSRRQEKTGIPVTRAFYLTAPESRSVEALRRNVRRAFPSLGREPGLEEEASDSAT